MKKSTISVIALILCALFATCCFTGCGSTTEANTNNSTSAIVGSWDSNEAPGTVYTFNEDGTGALSGDGYELTFTYTEKDGTVELTYEGASVQIYEYTIENDTLSLTDVEIGSAITYSKK